jgi:hypothetical protein
VATREGSIDAEDPGAKTATHVQTGSVSRTEPSLERTMAPAARLLRSARMIEHGLQGLGVEDPVGPGFKLGFPGLIQALLGPGR